jgi:hypothetical protein
MVTNFVRGLSFVFLAIPGALTLALSGIIMVGKICDPNGAPTGYPMLLLLAVAGALFTLVGLGKLCQWKFIFVFLSVPLSLFMSGIIVPLFIGPNSAGFLIPILGLAMFILPYYVNKLVVRHYKRMNS